MQDTTRVEPDWLAETFGLGRAFAMTQAGFGQSNPLGVLRLETSQGRFAIKQLEREPSRVALVIESAAYQSDFPMPQPIWTKDGQPYVASPNPLRQVWLRAFRWVEGTPYEWGTVNAETSTEVGRLLAKLHALSVPERELHEAKSWSPLGADGWHQLADQGIRLNLPWGQALHGKVHELVALEQHVLSHTAGDEPRVPSQRDLHPPNVIRCPDGKNVLIDWDGAGPVNAREEVAKFALVWASLEEQSPRKDEVHAFIEGYRSAGGRFETRGLSDLTHQTESFLWWLGHNLKRDVDGRPDSQPELSFALLANTRKFNVDALKFAASLLQI